MKLLITKFYYIVSYIKNCSFIIHAANSYIRAI
jgi:hypothetical protein